MSALAKTDYAAWSLAEAVVSDFTRKGAHLFDERLDERACLDLSALIRATRRFDESLFVAEAEFQAGPDRSRGRGLLERLEPRLGFVERSPQIMEALWSLLGPDYRILDRKVVCALPAGAIPAWVKRRVYGAPAGDLAAYVRPELRDIGYFHGEDLRQDLAGHDPDVVVLHVDVDAVGEEDGPTCLLEGSHRLGAAAFPHDLKRTGPDSWRYRNGRFGEMYLKQRLLTGEAGAAALWHPCVLRGALPNAGDHARISLRYRIGRGEAATAGIDAVNASLAGPARSGA